MPDALPMSSTPPSPLQSAEQLLRVHELQVAYGAVTAVQSVSFEVAKGEIVVLLGANGAGKSSTLNGIVGLSPVTAGQIAFRGEQIQGLQTEALARRRLTLCPEGRRVFSGLTVEENLRLGGYALKGRVQAQQRFDEMLTLFPILAQRRRQMAGTMSGGQQQMLAIARALMCDPELLLLDEPSLGLAPQIVEQVFELVAALRTRGVTILLVEQNVAMSLEIADRGYVMASGRIVAAADAATLRDSDVIAQTYLAH